MVSTNKALLVESTEATLIMGTSWCECTVDFFNYYFWCFFKMGLELPLIEFHVSD